MEYYKQCTMVLKDKKQTAWIPEAFAHVGRFLKIRKDGEWVNGWKVEHVGNRLDEQTVLAQERGYLKHRDVTDI